jgi:hypothetical protein
MIRLWSIGGPESDLSPENGDGKGKYTSEIAGNSVVSGVGDDTGSFGIAVDEGAVLLGSAKPTGATILAAARRGTYQFVCLIGLFRVNRS